VISYTWETKGGGPSGTNAKEVSAVFINSLLVTPLFITMILLSSVNFYTCLIPSLSERALPQINVSHEIDSIYPRAIAYFSKNLTTMAQVFTYFLSPMRFIKKAGQYVCG